MVSHILCKTTKNKERRDGVLKLQHPVGGFMQTKLREDIDADHSEGYVSITDYMTDQNKFEIICGSCSKILYADKETSDHIYRSVEQGLDNPYLCDDCQLELEELAYVNR